MISLIDPEVVNHVLRPTVYRGADARTDARADVSMSAEGREPQEASTELNRGFRTLLTIDPNV